MDFKCDELILGKKDADSRALTASQAQQPTYQRHAGETLLYEWITQVRTTCRAEYRVELSQCAVGLTAKGSVTPGPERPSRPQR